MYYYFICKGCGSVCFLKSIEKDARTHLNRFAHECNKWVEVTKEEYEEHEKGL